MRSRAFRLNRQEERTRQLVELAFLRFGFNDFSRADLVSFIFWNKEVLELIGNSDNGGMVESVQVAGGSDWVFFFRNPEKRKLGNFKIAMQKELLSQKPKAILCFCGASSLVSSICFITVNR